MVGGFDVGCVGVRLCDGILVVGSSSGLKVGVSVSGLMVGISVSGAGVTGFDVGIVELAGEENGARGIAVVG